ncbi:MAG: hypothetical protein J5925_00920 [Clostridia bacterium]|nr:hypothetical protein [Clostridia bacterium]
MNKAESKRVLVNTITLTAVAAVTVLFVVLWIYLFSYYNFYNGIGYRAMVKDGPPELLYAYSARSLLFIPLLIAAEVLLGYLEKRFITPPVSKFLLLGANLAPAVAAVINAVYWAGVYYAGEQVEDKEQIGFHLLFLSIYIVIKAAAAVTVFTVVRNKRTPENGDAPNMQNKEKSHA